MLKKFGLGFSIILILAICTFGFLKLKKQIFPTTIRIAINEWAGYAPFAYGFKAGIFEKHGVRLELVLTTSLKDISHLLTTKKIDAGAVVITDLVAMNSQGADLIGVFMLDESGLGDGFIASSEVRKFSDLKGASIAFETPNSFSHLYVLKLLSDNGIDLKDVKLVDTPFDHVPDHVKDKKVLAGHTWEPALSKALAKGGYTLLATGLDAPGMIVDFLAVQRELLEADPEVIESLKNAFYESQEKMLADHENTPEYFKEFYIQNYAEVYEGIKKISFISKEKNEEILNGPDIQKYFKAFEYIGNYFTSIGFIKDKNDIYKMIKTNHSGAPSETR